MRHAWCTTVNPELTARRRTATTIRLTIFWYLTFKDIGSLAHVYLRTIREKSSASIRYVTTNMPDANLIEGARIGGMHMFERLNFDNSNLDFSGLIKVIGPMKISFGSWNVVLFDKRHIQIEFT